MKGPVISIPFTNVNVGSEDIKSSDKGTSAEGTFASYHPCPKEVLQRFIKHGSWGGGTPTMTVCPTKLFWKSPEVQGSCFHLPLCFQGIKSTSTVAAGRTPSLPSLDEVYRHGERVWWADKGWRGLCSAPGFPWEYSRYEVQTNFPQKLHRHGTVWKVELFGFGEDWSFGKRWFSFETLFYPFVNRLMF